MRLDAGLVLDDQASLPQHSLWLRVAELAWPDASDSDADAPILRCAIERVAPTPTDRSRLDEIVVDLRDAAILPGFVNAHTHLDLTAVGPKPFDAGAGFAGWLAMIRQARPTKRSEIESAIDRGVALARAAGVVAVGDIAGAPNGNPTLAPWRALGRSPMRGTSFVEFFAIGTREAERIEGLRELVAANRSSFASPSSVRLGLQPHAPNTVGIQAYREAAALAAELGCPLATHLAESPAEREFIAHGTGPQRELLESVGFWHDSIQVGRGLHPVEHLMPVLNAARDSAGDAAAGCSVLVAHANDATDRALELLANAGVTIAYCPRAAAYFGFPDQLGPHRWREMRARGVPVALGTDSIVNLETEADDQAAGLFGPLADARLLARRDGATAAELLPMLTTIGASAVGLGAERFRLSPDSGDATEPLGIVAVPIDEKLDPESIFQGHAPPSLLFSGK